MTSYSNTDPFSTLSASYDSWEDFVCALEQIDKSARRLSQLYSFRIALQAAVYSGALEVQHGADNVVKYRTLGQMKASLRYLDETIAKAKGIKKPKRCMRRVVARNESLGRC